MSKIHHIADNQETLDTLRAFGDLHHTATSKAKPGQTVTAIQDPQGNTIRVGQDATFSCGDAYPARVKTITRVRGGWQIDLQQFGYRATEAGKAEGMGHQDWEILWDQPSPRLFPFKINLQGQLMNTDSGYRITIGHARVHYCWEF